MNDIKRLKNYFLFTKNEEVIKIIKESIKDEEKYKKRKNRHKEIEYNEEYFSKGLESSIIEYINAKEEINRIKIIIIRCSLNKEEKLIINKYFYENKPIKEIAKELNKSTSYIYKKINQIIEKLKEEYRLSFPFDYKDKIKK